MKIKKIIAILSVALALVPSAMLASTTDSVPTGYTAVWDGGGSITWSNSILTSAPTSPNSALVVSKVPLRQPYQIKFTMKTTKQLASAPQPWEVGWFAFGYKPDGKFKYFILKPNGFELGESLLNNNQNFLYTSSQPSFPINTTYNVILTVKNNVITVTVNGVKYLNYTISTKDVLTPNGQYGFYNENSVVQYSKFSTKQL